MPRSAAKLNCKTVYVSGSGEAMRWEYPICPEMKCLTLVVLRPYVSSEFNPARNLTLSEPGFFLAWSQGAFARGMLNSAGRSSALNSEIAWLWASQGSSLLGRKSLAPEGR